MTLFIGVDDTDSPTGMCTTYLLTEIISELEFPVLFGYPRLVRLNPNIPWKTRGNGALSLSIYGERSSAFKIGEIDGREILCSSSPSPDTCDASEVLRRVSNVVERLAELDGDNTNPAVAVSGKRPVQGFYWEAVSGVVSLDSAMNALNSAGGVHRSWKNGRGLIGATASIAWVPRDRTFEVITYRRREKWGTTRRIGNESVSGLSHNFPSTFSNYDSTNRHSCISPSSPCPVLFGIRGDDPSVLEAAMMSVEAEEKDRWLVFESNQGTDDHIIRPSGSLEPYRSYYLEGTVGSSPVTIRGGHVFFKLTTEHGEVTCAAFEETKELRSIVTKLIPGDRLSVWGSLKPGDSGYSFNLEKMEVSALEDRRVKVANPKCAVCGKPMHSAGRGAGYRCRACHTRSDQPIYRSVSRDLQEGLYGVAMGSRRHLAMPPERMQKRKLTPDGPPRFGHRDPS